MTWVLDRGLVALRNQVDAAWPHRDKSSDGSIGDAAHAASHSDHNPEHPAPRGNPDNQVDAIDITHDPAHGADMQKVADAIVASRDQRVSYLIHHGRIVDGDHGLGGPGIQPWHWRTYTGSNPHNHHLHVSVRDDHHDETQPWHIGAQVPVTHPTEVPEVIEDADLPRIADAVLDRTWTVSQAEANLLSGTIFAKPAGAHVSLRQVLGYGTYVGRSEDRTALEKARQEIATLNSKLDQVLVALAKLSHP